MEMCRFHTAMESLIQVLSNTKTQVKKKKRNASTIKVREWKERKRIRVNKKTKVVRMN